MVRFLRTYHHDRVSIELMIITFNFNLGSLTLAQGWLVWQTRKVSDALIRRTFCQAYCLSFLMQALILFRAQIASPENHSPIHWLAILFFIILSSGYGYFIALRPIKAFQLPGIEGC